MGPRIDLTVFLSGAVVAPDRKVEASHPVDIAAAESIFLGREVSSGGIRRDAGIEQQVVGRGVPADVAAVAADVPGVCPRCRPLAEPPVAFGIKSPVEGSVAQRLQQRLLLTAQVDAERDLRKRLFAAVEHHRGRLRMKSGYGPFVLRAENGRTLQYAERIALGGSGGGQQRQYRQEKGLHHRQIDFSNNTIDSLSSTQVIAAGI